MRTGKETILVLGGDGYLGWSLGLAFANRTDKKIVLVDNFVKRKWEKEAHAKLLVPFAKPKTRIAEYRRIFGKTNLSFEKAELLNQNAVRRIIRKYRPTVIINAAQQPSAPFAMSSAKNAGVTFQNNIIGHLNVLWSIAEIDKNIKYIKLGSAGCYGDTDTDCLPLSKKDLTFEHEGKTRKILNSFVPMQATDFYHQSKISDFLIDDLCARMWNLKVVTVQQATIFGATIPENHAPEHAKLSARFNYDSVFSTVMNRFVCQIVIDHPLTIYGDGSQVTGLISLSDTVENFLEFASMDVIAGEHQVVHNFTHRLSICDIARTLKEVEPSAKFNHMANPRDEGTGVLSKDIEIHRSILARHARKDEKLKNELARMIEFTRRYKANIDPSIIMPTVSWSVGEATTQSLQSTEVAQKKKLKTVEFEDGYRVDFAPN